MPRSKKKNKGKASKGSDPPSVHDAAKELGNFHLEEEQFPELGHGARSGQPRFRAAQPSDLPPDTPGSTLGRAPEQCKPKIPPSISSSATTTISPLANTSTSPKVSPTIPPSTTEELALHPNPQSATEEIAPVLTNPSTQPKEGPEKPPNCEELNTPNIASPSQPKVQDTGAIPKQSPKKSGSPFHHAKIIAKHGSSISNEGKMQYKIPTRGGPRNQGTEGREMQVYANHFPIKFKVTKPVNHYDLSFTFPWRREIRKSDEALLRRVFAQLVQLKVIPLFSAFDGMKNVFTSRKVDPWSGSVTVREIETDREVSVQAEIKLARSNIDLKGAFEEYCRRGTSGNIPQSAIQIVDIVLSQMAKEKCVTIGRNFFPDSSIAGHPVELPRGKTCWFGFFQSVRLGWKPMLNVDVANKPAVKAGAIIDYMQDFLARPGRGRNFPSEKPDFRRDQGREWTRVDDRDLLKLEKDLKGLKILYKRPDGQKRVWRFNKIMDSAGALKMEHDGRKMTVAQYFELAYKYVLKYPHLPCLHLGSVEKTFFIPAELCEMKCQALPRVKQLDEEQAALMIRQTAVSPADRKIKIEKQLRAISNVFQDDEFAKNFGLTVEGVMCKIPARVYNPPSLTYCDLNKIKKGENDKYEKMEFKIDPSRPGKWDMTRGPRGSRPTFIDSKPLNNWAILDLARTNPDDIDGFVDALFEEGDKIGYTVDFATKIESENPNFLDKVVNKFINLCNMDPKLKMILVITTGRNNNIYNGLKYEGDVVRKISTQFVQQKNIGKYRKEDFFPAKPSTLHNILLKVNSKLGGTNQALHSTNRPHILNKPVMIMGGDVTHAAPEFKGVKPSIAAVVGSMDPNASLYNCEVRLQNTGQNEEMIESMEQVTKNLLLKFRQKTNLKPQRIIFYRDGVSEGQFVTVLNIELAAIRRACFSLEPDWEPPITYIVAQKRHKTRLFPVDQRKDGVGKSGNVPAGTVVDQVIVHPSEFSFFLASHEGIQGTSKPTYYHVLWDDANMKSDDIIKMTYYLCHTYARCERSVSYPAPTYYAHLAAFRARVHHDALIDKGDNNMESKRKLEEDMNLANYFM